MNNKRPQRWKELMKNIHALEVGESISFKCSERDKVCIRSALHDPARYVYRGKGVYKTKSIFDGEWIKIERVREGEYDNSCGLGGKP
jgi:hypothetical protein